MVTNQNTPSVTDALQSAVDADVMSVGYFVSTLRQQATQNDVVKSVVDSFRETLEDVKSRWCSECESLADQPFLLKASNILTSVIAALQSVPENLIAVLDELAEFYYYFIVGVLGEEIEIA